LFIVRRPGRLRCRDVTGNSAAVSAAEPIDTVATSRGHLAFRLGGELLADLNGAVGGIRTLK